MSRQASYREFARLAELHRHLVGIVDQKVGREKSIIRKYIAAIDRRLTMHPKSGEYFARWRKDSEMATSIDEPGRDPEEGDAVPFEHAIRVTLPCRKSPR